MKLKIAISPCPNDIFIFSGLIKDSLEGKSSVLGDGKFEFEFHFHELETLNRGAQNGLWDIVKISYANFPFCSSGYQLLRCGGAMGKGCGPLLLSNRDGWDSDAEILVPGKFTTANFLLDFFHKTANKSLHKTFLPFDEIYKRLLDDKPCQGVVIHEMRFTYLADGLHLVQDLGEFWEAQTGFPIPLGAVAVRLNLGQDYPHFVDQLEGCIRRSLNWAYAHRAEALEICRRYSQSLSDSVLSAHIELYVNAFSMDLGFEGDQAAAYFLSHRREHGTAD